MILVILVWKIIGQIHALDKVGGVAKHAVFTD